MRWMSRYHLSSLIEMIMMEKQYIEQHDRGYWVAGTRISLDSIVYAYRRGAAPETIRRSFPLLTLEEVYGVLTFYLANESKIDQYLMQSQQELAEEAQQRRDHFRNSNAELYERLMKSRKLGDIHAARKYLA
jgi:uncharacterized protein (DUF433 family)